MESTSVLLNDTGGINPKNVSRRGRSTLARQSIESLFLGPNVVNYVLVETTSNGAACAVSVQ